MNILGLARHGLNSFEQIAICCVMLTAFISLLYAWLLRKTVLKKDKGTAPMQEVWNAIRVGANSYLKTQLRKILPIIGGLTVALFLSVYVVPASREAIAEFGEKNALIVVAIGRTIAFIMGATFSLLVGQLGMRMASWPTSREKLAPMMKAIVRPMATMIRAFFSPNSATASRLAGTT